MQRRSATTIPETWDSDIHDLWLSGKTKESIEAIVKKANSYEENKPKEVLVQLAYYLFLLGDYTSSSGVFKNAHELYPEDTEILLNLGICLSKANKNEEAEVFLKKLLRKDIANYTAWDALTNCYLRMNEKEKLIKAGNNSLILKDKKYGQSPSSNWSIPEDLESYKRKNKVISFSLWGNEKRYIFGALRNLLLAPDLYPDWQLWFHVDDSVSPGFLEIISQLGGKVIMKASKQTEKEKLCWRFHVANDPSVGYFLVRDVDSVFSVREVLAVDEWINSGKCFHIIRDWWTYTDLILAGCWGGIAGVLPNIQSLLTEYQTEKITSPNVDQWFLRDCIWRYVKTDCLIHDRCFSHHNATPIPGVTSRDDNHIGACEYLQKPGFQEKILSAWIAQGQQR